jgi:V8-like Glu-specific endopeptidase
MVFIVSTGGACLLGGCIGTADDFDDTESAQQGIVGGSVEGGFPGVGALIITAEWSQSTCTATAIDEEWLLTAAHCLEGREPWQVYFFQGTDTDRASADDVVRARSLHVHPGYRATATAVRQRLHDIALVRLREPVQGITTYPYHQSDLIPYQGAQIMWVGYGANQAGPTQGMGLKRRGTGYLDRVMATQLRYYGRSGRASPCSGDSGGPMFTEVAGELTVIGVVSHGDAYCRSYGVDTRVDAYADWIASTLGEEAVPDCDMAGGGCGNEACWPMSDNGYACYPSEGRGVGQPCNADTRTWGSVLPCGDGSVCLPLGDGTGQCTAFCTAQSECAIGEVCRGPIFSDIDDVGVCLSAAE